ncbi:MAG TPA: hypothetical protein DCS42_14005 [Nitrospiraceae bacterium]|jgi:hypothetical protein|nr:hypothetical protein [Nitrospiraceae bacterium]HAS55142.1 hypothetical protein [Nitrospiraceae bacterium]
MSEMEIKIKEAPTCPHCKALMEKLDARHLDWGTHFLWVCFNNECNLFVRGWKQMEETVGQRASYRYMIAPDNGQNYALPWFGLEYMLKTAGLEEQCAPSDEE